MGTALTPAQATEWYEFLKDLDNERRTRFRDLLSAAPIAAGTNAYTLKDFKDQDGLEDVELCIKDVVGFRVADVRIFLKYWKAHSGEVDVTNKPVMVTSAMLATSAAIARGDAPGVAAQAVGKAISKAAHTEEDTEGNSVFCSAAFSLRIDSSKLGKVAALGVDPEEADYVLSEKGFELSTAEYKSHVTSLWEWLDYTGDVKVNCREHDRRGLVLRITAFNDRLCKIRSWAVAKEYILLFFKKHKRRLTVVFDTDVYLEAMAKIGMNPDGTPTPAALNAPTGAMHTAEGMGRSGAPAARPRELEGWEATIGKLTEQLEALSSWALGIRVDTPALMPPAPAAPKSGLKPPAPAQKAAGVVPPPPVPPGGKDKEDSQSRWKRVREAAAAGKAARLAAEAKAAQKSAAVPTSASPDEPAGTPKARFLSEAEWGALTPAEQGQVRKERQEKQKADKTGKAAAETKAEPATKKKRGRSPAAAGAAGAAAGAPGADLSSNPFHPLSEEEAASAEGSGGDPQQ
jgi:hypothetical protein